MKSVKKKNFCSQSPIVLTTFSCSFQITSLEEYSLPLSDIYNIHYTIFIRLFNTFFVPLENKDKVDTNFLLIFDKF